MKAVLNIIISSGCKKVYFYGIDETLWESTCDELICSLSMDCDLVTISLPIREELDDELDLEISISDGCDKDIAIIYDNHCAFNEWRNRFLKEEQDAFYDW